jgi:hypothetical protein
MIGKKLDILAEAFIICHFLYPPLLNLELTTPWQLYYFNEELSIKICTKCGFLTSQTCFHILVLFFGRSGIARKFDRRTGG